LSPQIAEERGRPVGRYVLYEELASGGMGVVHLGRLVGAAGFVRTVAVKRLHPHLAKDPEFVAMFQDEARLAARVRHPNVVSTLDVVARDGELLLVMEYVGGESLASLMASAHAAGSPIPVRVASAVMSGVLLGLHAAHEARGVGGVELGIVHRDVSPQNVLVGTDGIARVLDFGIAKAVGRVHTTRDGQVKGKAPYMAPEQLRGRRIDARTDVYGASVLLWEIVTGQHLFSGNTPEEIMTKILERDVPPPSTLTRGIPPALDALVLRGLAREPEDRFPTAREMAGDLERIVLPATGREVSEWVEAYASEGLRQRALRVAAIEEESLPSEGPPISYAGAAVARLMEETTSVDALRGAPETSPSNPSVISDSSSATVPYPASRSTARVVALVTGGVLALAGIWLGIRPGTGGPPTTSVAAPATATSTTPLTVAVSEPSVAVAAASLPPATVSAPPLSRASAAPKRASPARRCNPPYSVDANGFRVPKAECF
jgi:serine/threonine protein kinase